MSCEERAMSSWLSLDHAQNKTSEGDGLMKCKREGRAPKTLKIPKARSASTRYVN